MPNIAPSVLGAAVINITGNLAGLRHAMNEARTQMYGMITIANSIGGKVAAGLFGPIASYRGMKAIDEAMAKAHEKIVMSMHRWQTQKPSILPAPDIMMKLWDPARYARELAAHQASAAAFPAAMMAWKETRPDPKAITDKLVQGAALSQGKLIAFGAALAITGAALAKATEYASAFTEQLNKVIQTFGLSSTMLIKNAAAAASMGLGKTAYLQGTSTLGIEFLGAGMAEKPAAAMAAQLAKRAADVASLYDIEVSTVLDKIRAGLAGFGRPLKELGIVITEGRVTAKAASMGLVEYDGYLSEEAKIRARAALILQLSNRAEGDFARTQGEFKNQLRTLGAEFDNFMTELGVIGQTLATSVLPAIIGLTENMNILVSGLNKGGAAVYNFVGGITSMLLGQGYDAFAKEQQHAKDIEDDRLKQVSRENEIARLEIKADEEAARKRGHVGHYDLVSYAKHLQESLFDKNIARQQLDVLKEIRDKKPANMNVAIKAPGQIAPEAPQ